MLIECRGTASLSLRSRAAIDDEDLIKTIKYEILQIVCHTDSDWDDVLLR